MDFIAIILPAIVAFFATSWVYPYILKVSKVKNIVDNPNARKLQRVPVPILGGLSVSFGGLCGIMSFSSFGGFNDMLPIFAAMIVIMFIGFIDDIIGLSPKIRFIIEILLVVYLITATGNQINNFHGLWNIELIDNFISLPLTVFACVGIINAINLIDGVDGYSSGYCIMACAFFGVMFYMIGDFRMVALALIVIAALIPFFLHNVFGKRTKMFIGDSGTLSLGIIMSIFVCNILTDSTDVSATSPTLGLIPFTLATMSVPIFDTLRVMSLRILRGKSPFQPDKTHLHHLFIELGFSHIGTTLMILSLNSLVILGWFISYKLGASIDVQLYGVIAFSTLITFVFYRFMRIQIANDSVIYKAFRRLGEFSNLENYSIWPTMQRYVDKTTEINIENLD